LRCINGKKRLSVFPVASVGFVMADGFSSVEPGIVGWFKSAGASCRLGFGRPDGWEF